MSLFEVVLVAILVAAVVGGVLLLAALRALGRNGAAAAAAAETSRRLDEELRARLQDATASLTDTTARASALSIEKAALTASLDATSSAAAARATDLESRLRAETQKVESVNREMSALRVANADLRAGGAKLEEALAQERKHTAERLVDLGEQKLKLRADFAALAAETIGRQGEDLSKSNKEQVEGLLAPLREQIGKFETELRSAHVDSTKDREGLRAHIQSLALREEVMVAETRQLTQALRKDSRAQGAWGEVVLARILEQSGLREGYEYEAQQSHTTDDGARLRPDVLVRMPEGSNVAVDSKVSLTAYTDLVSEVDDAERAGHVGRHTASIRAHIKSLSQKNYAQLSAGGLDFVVMFVPIEGALAAAIQHDPQLLDLAAEQNVALATPTTLLMALKTVASVWRVERRNKNAEEIAAHAGSCSTSSSASRRTSSRWASSWPPCSRRTTVR